MNYRSRLRALYALLLGANVIAWSWSWAVFGTRPALLGLALLAWVFGLRHAVEADHIAAIGAFAPWLKVPPALTTLALAEPSDRGS
jgi:high-affinity nickel permease